MDSNNQNQILALLLLIIMILSVLCLLGGITLGIIKLAVPTPEVETESDTSEESSSEEDTATSVTPQGMMLPDTSDAGTEYIDKMIFFGESTTAHLRSRGVLSGGTDTHQVWTDSSGTRMLSSRITSEPIVYPPTGEKLTVAEACQKEKPAYLVLSFGLNGITNFISNKDQYVSNYGRLIAAIQAASPDTKIILQTVYPVCKANNYSVDVETLNGYIATLNSWLPEIAAKYENVRVADTASVLLDSNDKLNSSYDNGDGIHLTTAAYEQILDYLRTHAWQ